MAEEKKAIITTIEDLNRMDDRSIQLVLRDVDQKDVVLALMDMKEPTRNRVMANLSRRAAAIVKDDMALAGKVDEKPIGEACARIVNVLKRLVDMGEITVQEGPSRTTSDPIRSQTVIESNVEIGETPPGQRDLEGLVRYLQALARKSRCVGLLGIEPNVDRIDEELLRIGLEMVVDGTDYAVLDGILRERRKNLLAQYEQRLDMIITAVDAISAGDSPSIMEAKCRARMAANSKPARIMPDDTEGMDKELAGPGPGKRDAEGLVHYFAALARKARMVGLLGIEDDVEKIDEELARSGLRLIVDGTDRGFTKSILTSRKAALLIQYGQRLNIIIDGAMAISSGDNPVIVGARCRAHIPAPVKWY